MVREIKFRAWDTKWEDGMCYSEHLDGDFFVSHEGLEFKYMQYTGLKDKNGKEIYEGDIVRVNIFLNEFHTDKPHKKIICEIIYSEHRCSFLFSEVERLNFMSLDALCEDSEMYSLLVIGNIYENPELLKEE